jgi:phage repressor protein C with HTH and peptisase S24 domain
MIRIPFLTLNNGLKDSGNSHLMIPQSILTSNLNRLESLRAYTALGASMEPTLIEGDTLIVDTSNTDIFKLGIYALNDRFGDIAIKRVDCGFAGNFTLRSDSSNKIRYPDFTIEDINLLKNAILGKVVWRSGVPM